MTWVNTEEYQSPGSSGSLGTIAGYQLATGDTATSDAAVTRALAAASNIARDASGGQTFALETETAWLESQSYTTTLFLPQLPVVSVASVALDGQTLTETTDYKVDSRLGALVRVGGCWPCGALRIAVEYTHGYTDIPEDVQSVVYAIAQRSITNPSGQAIQLESIGSYEVRYFEHGGASSLTTDELAVLAGYDQWGLRVV